VVTHVRARVHSPEHPLFSTEAAPETIRYRPVLGGPEHLRVVYPDGTVADAEIEALLRARGRGRAGDDPDRVFVRGQADHEFERTNVGLLGIRGKQPYPGKYVQDRTLKAYARSGGVFLDYACGGGRFTLDVGRRGVKIYGFDLILPPHLLDPDNPLSDRFVQARGQRTGFRAGSIAGMFLNFAPPWVTAREMGVDGIREYLEEGKRVLQPGGFAVIGPANVWLTIDAAHQAGLSLYESSRDSPSGKYVRDHAPRTFYDFVVLEKPTPHGEPTLLDKVFGPRRRTGERDTVEQAMETRGRDTSLFAHRALRRSHRRSEPRERLPRVKPQRLARFK
jgi:SAM-dependent methyltransferase